ncbi:hypothetical protein QJS04_geneDACA000383 [Acorus gramineus]|uniref:Sec-independent protein translocase protein TATB, chloroplastic n=1 Tax=Acorus gramineus TaxID=55184 RepID=A0AAV9ARD6_ACOGR|nr:hypothetical protein QJS04_geneDACA000383 [Acorus gramineus]
MATAIASSTTTSLTFYISTSPIKATPFTSPSIACKNYIVNPRFRPLSAIPQLGLKLFSPWSGLKPLGTSPKQTPCLRATGDWRDVTDLQSLPYFALLRASLEIWDSVKDCLNKQIPSLDTKRRRKFRGVVVYASLFGVGAPEALVIGVVALLVFGPKGLAEVARNLGKTLRAFQPTIKELQEVSREFKSTLEKEIGLDDVSPYTKEYYNSRSSNTNEKPQDIIDPNGTPPTKEAYTSEELLKITEEQLKESALTPQTQASSPEDPIQGSSISVTATPEDTAQTASSTAAAKPTSPQVQEKLENEG